MTTQFNLPVYLLTDNDTWGYYFVSVLKNGSIAPHKIIPDLAVKHVRYLGLRPGEFSNVPNGNELKLPWNDRWKLRLRAMSKYPCFASSTWKEEFRRFKAQRGKIDLEHIVIAMRYDAKRHLSPNDCFRRFVRNYLAPKLANRDWLT